MCWADGGSISRVDVEATELNACDPNSKRMIPAGRHRSYPSPRRHHPIVMSPDDHSIIAHLTPEQHKVKYPHIASEADLKAYRVRLPFRDLCSG